MKKFLGLYLGILIFVVQFFLISGTGMTWDEPSSFFFGRANLKFWLTGSRAYLTDLRSTALFADSPFRYIYGEDLYPPFPFVVASAFSYILSEHAHLLPVIDAHHLGEVFLGSIGVWAFYGIAVEIGMSTLVAGATTIIFALYPTIFGQMRSDAKDLPLMSLLTVFVYTALRFISSLKQKSFATHIKWAMLAGIAFALAFASKPTAPIILIPLGVWFIGSFVLRAAFRKAVGPLDRLVPLVFLAGLIGLTGFFVAWPWLWDNPIDRLNTIWRFFRIVGLGMGVQYFGHTYQAGISLPREYAFVILLVQTPIEITVLALIGTIAAVVSYFKKNRWFGLFVLLWFLLGMARFLVPGIIIYAKVRHFIDVMPAFFLLVGLGIEQARRFVPNLKIYSVLVVIVIAHLLWIDVTLYPYEPSYFNALVGGTNTVAGKRVFDVEYWGSTVAEAMRWVSSQPGDKVVYPCTLRHLVLFYSDPSVRISFTPDIGDYVIVPNAYSWFGGPMNTYSAAGKPLYTISRAGADFLDIYKITSATWWCGYETDMDAPARSL